MTEAVTKTFDGKHPCVLCKVIKKGRAAEEQQEREQQTKLGAKLDAAVVWKESEYVFSGIHETPSWPEFSAPSRSEEPPKPRPRGFLPIRFT